MFTSLDNMLGDPYRRYLRLTEGDGGEGGTGGGSGEGSDGGGTDDKKFSQAEVDRIAGRRASEAERSAAKKLSDELGMTVDEAKALIAAKAQADDEAKSETQRALDAAKAAQQAADQARADAARERLTARLERKLTGAGVEEKALARAVRLIELDPDATDDDLTAEIEALKGDVPGLFGTSQETPPPGRQPAGTGTGGGHPRPPAGGTGKGVTNAIDKGRERFTARKTRSGSTAA